MSNKYLMSLVIMLSMFQPLYVQSSQKFCMNMSPEDAGFARDNYGSEIIVYSKTNHKMYVYNCFKKNKIIDTLRPHVTYKIVKGNYDITYRGKHWSLLIPDNGGFYNSDLIIGWVSHSDLRFEKKHQTNNYQQRPISENSVPSFMQKDFCFENRNNIQSLEKNDEGTVFHVWVVKNNVKAYRCPGKDDAPVSVEIRNRYCIVAGNYRKKLNGKKWSLLTTGPTGIKTIIGWVDHDNLIFSSKPLKNDRTGIDEKVLIKEGDTPDGKGLKLFTDCQLENPETSLEHGNKSVRAIHVRTVFYVYDYFPHDAGEPESDATKSLLISPNVFLNKNKNNAPMLLGWVDRKKVTFWNNREACETPVGESMTLKDLSGRIMFQSNVVKKPLSHKTLRNPILEKLDRYLKIGVFAELDANQLILREQIENISTGLEVLFVIDGSRSMTRAFEGTLNAVERIANKLKSKADNLKLERPRLGLLFYRDKQTIPPVRIINGREQSTDKAYCTQEITLSPLGDTTRFIQKLYEQVACDSDTTVEESVYKGLIEGIQNCGFHTGADNLPTRMRVVIHIGDAGDNNRGNFSYDDVASVIRKYKIFRYIAMDVTDTNSLSTNFYHSIKPIINELGQKVSVIEKVDVNNLVSRVYAHLSRSQQKTERLDEQIKIISRGFAGTAEGKAGVVSQEILNYANDVIKANKIDLNPYEPFQQYIEGYIDIGTPIKKFLLIERLDIERVGSFLQKLIDSENLTTKKEAWNGYLELILGNEKCIDNKGKPLKITECNRKRNGIPIPAGFMTYTREQFINLDANASATVICEAKQVLERFRFLGADKGISIMMINSDTCEYDQMPVLDLNNDGLIVKNGTVQEKGKPPRKATGSDLEDLFFFDEGSGSVAWIPLEYLGQNNVQRMY